MVRLRDESDCEALAAAESGEAGEEGEEGPAVTVPDTPPVRLGLPDFGGTSVVTTSPASLAPPLPPGHPHENNNHVMAFSRTLRQKLGASGFRSISQASTPTSEQPERPIGKGMRERQVSETPSTSSRMVTIVQNIYVYVSGSSTPETALSRPLRLRKSKSSDEAFLDDGNPKYRACCARCHVTRSAFVIGLVELVFAAMNLVDAVRNVAVTGRLLPSFLELLFAFCFVTAVVLMIVGVRTERKALLIPHLVWSIVFVVIGVLVIVAILSAWLFAGSLLAWTLATAQTNVQQSFDTLGSRTALNGNRTSAPPDAVEYNTGEEDGKAADDYFQPPSLHRLKRWADDAQDQSLSSAGPWSRASFFGRAKRETKIAVEAEDAAEDTKRESKAVQSVLWGIVVLLVLVFLICVGLEIWFFLIIRATYEYLKDKEAFLTTISTDGVVVHKPLATLEERDSEDDL